MMLSLRSLDAVVNAFDGNGFWFPGAGHPITVGDVCLFGIRNASDACGAWDDAIGVAYVQPDRSIAAHLYRGTTDPGREGIGKGRHPRGVATLIPGQHRRIWTFGIHAKGRPSAHDALVQAGQVNGVWRDQTEDGRVPRSGKVYTDAAGINLHRASRFGSTGQVGDYSHGCQVLQQPQSLAEILSICRGQPLAGLGSHFSYTLFDVNEDPSLQPVLDEVLNAA